MKLSADKSALLWALTSVAAIAERRRDGIPILNNVLIEAEGETARLTATDLNLEAAMTIPASVEKEGATTVAAQLLYNIVKEAASQKIDLSLDQALHVHCGRSRYRLNPLPCDDFPKLPPRDFSSQFKIPGPTLAKMLRQVEFAQCREDSRRDWCGVGLEVREGELLAVAMDGKMLAIARTQVPSGAEELSDHTLPSKFVNELLKLIGDDDVSLSFTDNIVRAEIGSAVLTGKLLGSSLPDWRRVVPKPNGRCLLAHREALSGAVRRAALVADEKVRAAKLELTRDKITVSVVSQYAETAAEEAPAAYDAADLTIGFNSRFLLDTFAAIGSDEIQVDFGPDATSLALFTNPNDASAQWVIAPTRI